MTVDALLFLQRSDVAHYSAHAERYAGLKQIFIDPGILEDALSAGLNNYELRKLDVGRHFHARITSEAMTRAAMLDIALCAERRALFGEGQFQGWDQALHYLYFVRLLCARELGLRCRDTFAEGSIGLFRPEHPQLFYFDSAAVADVFAAASPRFRIVDSYAKARHWVDYSNDFRYDYDRIAALAAAGRAQAITHLPTCYYDNADVAQQVEAAFGPSVDLPSIFWDIPIRRDETLLARMGPMPAGPEADACNTYRERARHILLQQLSAVIPNRTTLEAQVELQAQRCHLQAVNYHGLLKALRGHRPHFVISDQDTGSHGPLYTIAAQLEAPITMVPHSAYASVPLPHSIKVRAIERAGNSTSVRTVYGEPVAKHPVRLGAPLVEPTARERLTHVCLLLNTLTSEGLSHVDFFTLTGFHRALAALCAHHQVQLTVRLKPNGPSVRVASGGLGVAADVLTEALRAPMDDVARQADLCVGWGEPSSAGIRFLEAGSYMVQVTEQLWPSDAICSPGYVEDGLVPCWNVQLALQEIGALLADPALFVRLAAEQRSEFLRRVQGCGDQLFEPPALAAAA